eukprot:2342151-Prymnesium_polylepis.1
MNEERVSFGQRHVAMSLKDGLDSFSPGRRGDDLHLVVAHMEEVPTLWDGGYLKVAVEPGCDACVDSSAHYRRRSTRTRSAGRAQAAPRPFRGAHRSRVPRRGCRRPTPQPPSLPAESGLASSVDQAREAPAPASLG